MEEDSARPVKVELNRIRVILDPVAAWGQAFEEAWRLQRDFFWTADMAGQDWDSVYKRYRPMVDRLGSHDDLVDLLWEIHGELGTSHAYVKPAAVSEPGRNGQGRLGAELHFGSKGWEITRILAGESSDPLATSPLTRPGADAKVGDVLLAIDGVELSAALTPAMQLVGAAGRTVELTLLERRRARLGPPGPSDVWLLSLSVMKKGSGTRTGSGPTAALCARPRMASSATCTSRT